MSDTVNLRNGQALDARFMAVDERFTNMNKDLGRIENRVEGLEQKQGLHHDGLTKHDYAIDKLTKAIDEVTITLKEFADIKNQVKGGITLWKWVLVPVGGFSGILYITKTLWGGL